MLGCLIQISHYRAEYHQGITTVLTRNLPNLQSSFRCDRGEEEISIFIKTKLMNIDCVDPALEAPRAKILTVRSDAAVYSPSLDRQTVSQ